MAGIYLMGAGGGEGGVELDISYSQTEPSIPKALWIKGNPPTTKVILSSMLTYGNILVEDTGATNSYSSDVIGGGFYNNKYYFVQSTATPYTLSMYVLDPNTLTVSSALANFTSVGMFGNSASQAKAAVKGNKMLVAMAGTGADMAVVDLETLVCTTYSTSTDILTTGSRTGCAFVPAVADNKIWRAGTYSTFYCIDYVLNISTAYTVGAGNYGYLLDDGYHLYMLPYTGETASVFDYNAGTISHGICPTYVNALFQVGNEIYVGAVNSIYKWNYDGTSTSFTLVSSDTVAWGRNGSSENYVYGYGGDVAWVCGFGYAVNQNVLYCIATPRAHYVQPVAIKRITFENTNYPVGSVIISTTPTQKNRAKLITDEKMDLDIFVDAVYAVGDGGTITQLEAYTRDSAGEWIAV